MNNNYIDTKTGGELKSFIRSDECCLVELSLQGANMGNSGVIALFEGLKENRTLKMLDLAANKISDEAGMSICEFFYE